MSELKISITILVSYVIVVLGIANIDSFQESLINFSPAFFVLIAGAVFMELLVTGNLIKNGVKTSNYTFPTVWGVVYVMMWLLYWRGDRALPLQVQIMQFTLLELAAGLAYDVSRRIGVIDKVLDGLTTSTYPNRTKEIQAAQEIINDEFTRSRRYHHPLSMLVLRLENAKDKDAGKHNELLERDMLERFANAKVGQILSDLSRSTDIIIRDQDGAFIILCPETDHNRLSLLADRIASAADESLGARIAWGIASFPDEALDFKDLLQTAKQRVAPVSFVETLNVSTQVGHTEK